MAAEGCGYEAAGDERVYETARRIMAQDHELLKRPAMPQLWRDEGDDS